MIYINIHTYPCFPKGHLTLSLPVIIHIDVLKQLLATDEGETITVAALLSMKNFKKFQVVSVKKVEASVQK